MKSKAFNKIILLMSLTLVSLCYGETLVIVNPSNSNNVTKDVLIKIYLAKVRTFPDGTLAAPVNHSEDSPLRLKFDSSIIGKSSMQMRAHWARLLFTGRAVPLKVLKTDAEVIDYVSKTLNAVGYINSENKSSEVKIAFEF